MTRAEVNRMLGYMETCRELSYEAETKSEERRLIREYSQMSKAIMPYITGKKPYTDEASHAE